MKDEKWEAKLHIRKGKDGAQTAVKGHAMGRSSHKEGTEQTKEDRQ